MRVQVKYFATFCLETDFVQQEEISVQNKITVRQLIERLVKKYGDSFRERVFTEEDKLDPVSWVVVNGRRLKEVEELSINLNSGDIVSFSPPQLVGG